MNDLSVTARHIFFRTVKWHFDDVLKDVRNLIIMQMPPAYNEKFMLLGALVELDENIINDSGLFILE